jgi:hypothetical protein
MVEILFTRIAFTINGKTCDVWFAGTVTIDGEKTNLVFDTKKEALDFCSAHDVSCGFME